MRLGGCEGFLRLRGLAGEGAQDAVDEAGGYAEVSLGGLHGLVGTGEEGG